MANILGGNQIGHARSDVRFVIRVSIENGPARNRDECCRLASRTDLIQIEISIGLNQVGVFLAGCRQDPITGKVTVDIKVVAAYSQIAVGRRQGDIVTHDVRSRIAVRTRGIIT